jgi:hypothetical protein
MARIAGFVGARTPERVLGWREKLRTASELAFGVGITENIAEGYREVVRLYRPGDQIFLLGFSRGAFTARCIAGVIGRCGLLRSENVRFAEDVVQLYRYRQDPKEPVRLRPGLAHETHVSVRFMGVWDTVASLGVPLWGWWFTIGSLWSNASFSTSPATVCETVRHALSIDEERSQFFPTLFETPPSSSNIDLEQVWFRGSHGGVGGGYDDSELSDVSLDWMVEQARALGLEFVDDAKDRIKANAYGFVHKELDRKKHWQLFASWPRWHPCPRNGTNGAEFGCLHPSVYKRATLAANGGRAESDAEHLLFLDPATNGSPGAVARVPIRADQAWNRTGVVLERGFRYRVEYVSGAWRDRGPNTWGPPGRDKIGPIQRSTRRLDSGRWMELLAHVAHPRSWDLLERPGHMLLKYLLIRDPEELTRTLMTIGRFLDQPGKAVLVDQRAASGVLYAFANGSWLAHPDYSGALVLQISCVGPIPADASPGSLDPPCVVVQEDGEVLQPPQALA